MIQPSTDNDVAIGKLIAGVGGAAVAAMRVELGLTTLHNWSQPKSCTMWAFANALSPASAFVEVGGEGAHFGEADAVQLGLMVDRRGACRRRFATELANALRKSGPAYADVTPRPSEQHRLEPRHHASTRLGRGGALCALPLRRPHWQLPPGRRGAVLGVDRGIINVIKKPTKHRLPGMSCPHCNGPSTVRFARPLSAMVREVTYRCENDDCGHGFVAQLAAIRTTIPSANPNPAVHLPFAKPGMLAPVPAPRPAAKPMPTPANDDRQPVVHPPAANDPADLMTG